MASTSLSAPLGNICSQSRSSRATISSSSLASLSFQASSCSLAACLEGWRIGVTLLKSCEEEIREICSSSRVSMSNPLLNNSAWLACPSRKAPMTRRDAACHVDDASLR
eukprot:763809-Hanusia_phi.AAC.4